MLVTGNITATGGDEDTNVAFKNCTLFAGCINDEHVETAENLHIIMLMYNLLEYSNNYADSSGSLYQFKRDEQIMTNAGNPDNVTTVGSSSFKCKSSILGNLAAIAANTNTVIVSHALISNAKIVVPLKYLSNFFRSLEMSLIIFKIHLELNWRNNCVISTVADTTFQITGTKLYIQVVTLSIKDNVNLKKQLSEGFKRSVYWNEYKPKIETREANTENLTTFYLDAFCQGVNRLFVLAFDNTNNGPNKVEKIAVQSIFFQE